MSDNTKPAFRTALIFVTALFFLWGLAVNLNPILIPHLKRACQLDNFRSALIDTSMFLAYFCMALPAGRWMQRFGYQSGIVAGLLLFALGAFLMWPAAAAVSYPFFLTALFILASGLAFLETAANPFVTVLGGPEKGTQRLNLAQSFNGLAAALAPFLGGLFILTGTHLTEAEIQVLPPEQLAIFLQKEASTVKIPFLVVGLVVLSVAIVFGFLKLPDIREKEDGISTKNPLNLLKNRQLRAAVLAQFFYVGAQVCVSSFFIRLLVTTAGSTEKAAAGVVAFALLMFMVGRFVGTWLMQFFEPARLLFVYAMVNILLLALAIFWGGKLAIGCLVGVEFFMSIMFPTIFSLGVRGLGKDTKLASSLLIMAIVGGAILPLLMGRLADSTSIQTAYLVPLACFGVVAWFGKRSIDSPLFSTES